MNKKSGHWTNTGMAKFINDNLYNYKSDDEKSMNPFRWYRLQNGDDVSKYRETINGFPCRLILINDGSTPLNEGQNEPTPGNTKDMGIFNFNHDKDATKTLGFDSDVFPNCASYEVTANSDTSAGAFMGYDGVSKLYVINSFDREHTCSEIPIEQLVNNNVINIRFEGDFESAYIRYTNASNSKISQVGMDKSETHSLTPPTEATHAFFIFIRNINTDLLPEFTMYINDQAVRVIPGEEQSGIISPSEADELAYLKESFELRHPDEDDVAEDWGFMGVETEKPVPVIDYSLMDSDLKFTTVIEKPESMSIETASNCTFFFAYYKDGKWTGNSGDFGGTSSVDLTGRLETHVAIGLRGGQSEEYIIINGVKYLFGNEVARNTFKDPYPSETVFETVFNTSYSLKALIDWVDNCTDEEFVADFEEHFHKDYTLRYFCLVTLIGAVDNLGKNMMLDTADNKIYFPRFYDIDTICSYDNSGQLKFDVDIEMEQGYWNTSSSRLWTRIRDLMHDDIVTTYNNMRQNGVSYENMMHYIYDEQIAKIPQTYYNKDYDVKYAPFADSYIGMAHGDTYEHVKRWLKQRFTFVDTLFDYAPSYNNDVLTIRANTTELMTLEIETYTPVYQHVSWYNGQMDKKKIDGKVSVEFSGTAQAATDQEVLIYGGSNVKSIKGITSMNPNRMLIGSATKLVEIDAHDCPLLADINANKANLSPHEYLNKVDLSNCPLLEGNLRLNNSPLVQEINIKGTNITGMNLPSSIRNLQVLRLPNTITELTLNDAGMLHTLEFDEGVNLQSVSMINCNALENVINFDLLQTPSITLDNSYNNVSELYFRDTTNLTVRNMKSLERVIYTPNDEYETFELINVANAPNYKVTTFNCPKLSTFMTTAPYRESFNDCGMKDKELVEYIDSEIQLDVIQGYEIITTGTTAGDLYQAGGVVTDFIEVKSGATYTVTTGTTGSSETVIAQYDENKKYIKTSKGVYEHTATVTANTCYIRISSRYPLYVQLNGLLPNSYTIQVKDYGDIQPNTTFTANSIDISNTQFTDVKLLCTTDVNTLKLPTTVKNFYCDSSFDLDTDYLEDGEYDVVHGELIEPYTTDYEGEVRKSKYNTVLLSNNTLENISVVGGTILTYTSNSTLAELIKEYDSNNNLLADHNTHSMKTLDNSTGLYKGSMILNNNTSYINITALNTSEFKVTLTESFTPNLIPSSADGSLIFSMYAPSNTVAPASGTWDLKGLEFDNFHTFGMNNDVYHARVSENIINNTPVYYLGTEVQMRIVNDNRFGNFVIDYSNGVNKWAFYIAENGYLKLGYNNKSGSWTTLVLYSGFSFAIGDVYDLTFKNDILTFTVNDILTYQENLNNLNIVEPYVDKMAMVHTEGAGVWSSATIEYTSSSTSMPARYDDYNITIKNAHISPKTHNTMLYPLLVNEDNPIEGKLDYTNYAGNNLSWSFAYVNMNKVNIVQPKDELLNTYEYRYNAFYETEYEFDDPNEVLRYITSSSNLLPTFNEGFTYTYDKLDNNDGTYIYRIYANDPTLLTSFELEKVPYLRITNAENLLSPIDLTKYETVSISESYYDITELYFSEATNLTLTNMPYLERVIYLPNDEYEVFEIINVVNSKDYIITTSECPRLTTFMTTASHRESYNNEDAIAEVITEFTNTDNELFTNEYVFSKTYWEEDGTEIQGSVNLLHYEIPSIEDSVKAIHMVQGLDSTNRVTFFNDDKFISCEVITTACELDFKLHRDCNRIVFICEREGIISSVVESILTTTLVKEYGSVEPNIIFNANTLDISNTQFTDVKLLCTTDLNVLKLPTTIKNFYCDSSFDLDTDYLTDGEYDVVHGELVEQYTTDYEGEVKVDKGVNILNIVENGSLGAINTTTGVFESSTLFYSTDYINVEANSFIYFEVPTNRGATYHGVVAYDVNKTYISGIYKGGGSDSVVEKQTLALPNGTVYIRAYSNNDTAYIEYNAMSIPNLIPSSADGSLIFSMYAPSKAVQPASNTWDLYGLEFDNFHTFGMNNDVKGEYIYERYVLDSSKLYKIHNDSGDNAIWWYDGWLGEMKSNNAVRLLPLKISDKNLNVSISGNEGSKANLNLMVKNSDGSVNQTESSTYPVSRQNAIEILIAYFGDTSNLEYIDIDLSDGRKYRIYVKEITNIYSTNATLTEEEKTDIINNYTFNIDSVVDMPRSRNIVSLTMPSRYNNYNVTIKNANISPKTHNTMLYPLLVNEDNPIEGKLDYTDYNGEYLSWSFAYTNTNKVNIIQPKDELLNSYEYRYNAFYRTEYEFNNPNEVMEYTTTSSNLLPIFNEGFTYAYDKIDNDDGTYTYKIYANDISLLTSFELEKVPYLRIVNAENLVLPIDLTKYEVVEIDNSYSNITELYFRDSTNLTLNNMSNLERVIYLPNNEYETFELINVANAPDYKVTTFNCPKLSTFMTTAPYRESFNNCGTTTMPATIGTLIYKDYSPNGIDFSKVVPFDYYSDVIEAEIDLTNCDATHTSENILSFATTKEALGTWGNTPAIHIYYTPSSKTLKFSYHGNSYNIDKIITDTIVNIKMDKGSIYLNNEIVLEGSIIESDFSPSTTILIGSKEGSVRSTALYKLVGVNYGEIDKEVKDHGDIQPNITFTANSIDISNAQFTDVKLLCTTDVNTLKLPTTVKNFYCDSSFDLDTDYLEDGEYDVVHGELVEPYTTEYEGEVNLSNDIIDVLDTTDSRWINSTIGGNGVPVTGIAVEFITNFISVNPSTTFKIQSMGILYDCRLYEYDTDKSYIGLASSPGADYTDQSYTFTLSENTRYVRPYCQYATDGVTGGYRFIYKELYTPNLIPSSADGSLIFSMYAPSNTVAPASGTWDLKGLEFDNFHTFGMNNDVKQEMISETFNFTANSSSNKTNIYENDGFYNITTSEDILDNAKPLVIGVIRNGLYGYLRLGKTEITTFSADEKWKLLNLATLNNNEMLGNIKIAIQTNTIRVYNGDNIIIKVDVNDLNCVYPNTSGVSHGHHMESFYISQIVASMYNASITMPSRYDDYNITIKNADISPTTHNTMLYPLLVNEDNPITGTLDYTNYAGKHLSWSFAYTDEEYVNIIQPKDELINSYKYKYNTYYDTEYEFDNPYEIARYTSSASGVLPTFNAEFTYTYDEKDNRDGTYTTKIYADSLDNLPTSISFNGKTTLLTVDKLNTSKVTNMYGMFQNCGSLTSLDLSGLDTNKVTNMGSMFQYCNALTSLDVSKFDTSKVTNMSNMFNSCAKLSSIDLSGFDTSNVTSMNDMFNGCSKLTSLDVSGFDTGKVTNMQNMFNGCSELTSLDLSGFDTGNVDNMIYMFNACTKLSSIDLSGFDTGNVASMLGMFRKCSGLTSLDVSGFDTSNVTSMNDMFNGCSGLTSLDVSGFDTSEVTSMQNMFGSCKALTSLDLSSFDTSKVTDMSGMFYNCWSLKEVKGIENWDCSKVAKFGSMFQGATAFGGDLDLRNWKVGQNTTVTEIFGFMNGCANLKSVDMSGWVLPDGINFVNFMVDQGSLHTVRVIGWSATNIQNICGVIGTYVGGTIYGDVIIDETYLRNDWVYDNALEIAIYTCSASGVLPNFNTEFTYTHAEVDNEDGTYTTKVVADSIDNLPTNISFYTKSALLSVERMNVSKVTSAQGMFYQCSNVTHINSSNWDTSSMTSMNNMFNGCSKLTSLDVSGFDTKNVTNMFGMFSGCSGLTSLDVSGFVTSNVTTIANMFYGCKKLTSLDLSGFDTKNVTTMNRMFDSCNSLTVLDVSGFDTSKVTDMQYMFGGCNNLTSLDVSKFDTSKVTIMLAMFSGCNSLTTLDVSGFNTSSVNNMNNMFQNCNNLTSLDVSGFDTSKVDAMNSMFFGCNNLTSLDVSNFDTSNVTNMNSMFRGCSGLTSLDVSGFDTSKVTTMNSMFYGCGQLTSLDVSDWVVDKVTDFQNTFYLCKSLTTLDVSNWNVTKDNISAMFRGCASLTKLNLSNWGVKLTVLWYVFQGCTSLTSVNLNNVIGELGTIDGVFSECFNLKTVYANNCTTTNLEKLIAKLPVVTPTSTIQGSVLINESLLPSGWVYDNALEVAMYTCNASGILPTFNTEFTYTHAEVDNGDGTYTTKVVADSIDNLPTSISFQNLTSLLTVEKLNTANVINMANMFNGCLVLTEIKGIEKWDVSNVIYADSVFKNCKSITSLDLTNWQLSNVEDSYGVAQMFMGCSKLTEIKGVNNLLCNRNIIKRVDDMFNGCTNLTTLDLSDWGTSNVITMANMFQNCNNLTSLDVSGFDTSKVNDMSSMFNGCSNLTSLDVSNFDTSNVTNMSMMFKNCNNLTTLDVSNFDTSKVTNMSEMFFACGTLSSIEGLGNWDVKNVTDMGNMFLHCKGITSLLEISDWDTSSLKSLYRTFMGCTELIELDVSNWNTSKLETLLETFYSCSKIISFNLGNWDCRRVISINAMFHGCSSLSSVILPKEVGKGCNAVSALRNCTNLKEVALPKGIGNISHMLNNCYNLEKAVIPLDDITDVQDTTFNNCRALVDIDWVGDLSNNFNIISNTGEHVTTESDVHELMTNLGDLKKDKIKISLSKGTIKVNDTEKTIE